MWISSLSVRQTIIVMTDVCTDASKRGQAEEPIRRGCFQEIGWQEHFDVILCGMGFTQIL